MDEHIRIGDVAPRVQYVADGVQSAFTYPFPIFEAADLEVRLDARVLASGFTVAGAGQSQGGSVTFTVAPASGAVVTLRRNLVVARTTDFQENGILRSRTLNDELDYQVAALQEVKEELGQAIRLDPSEVGSLAPLPPARRAPTACSPSTRSATSPSSTAARAPSPCPIPAACRARSRTSWARRSRRATSAPPATAWPMTGRRCRPPSPPPPMRG